MNKEVYGHLLATFGRSPGYWFGFATEFVRALIGRVVTVLILANIVASVSVGDFDSARDGVILWTVLTAGVTLLANVGDLVAALGQDKVYDRICLNFYRHLTHKDMSFYRDNHTGYMTALSKQYSDNAMDLATSIRGDILRTAISLAIPPIVLLVAEVKVGLAAIAIVLFQLFLIFKASKKADKHRMVAREAYKEAARELADDMTNIVAYKSSGKEDSAYSRMQRVVSKETLAFDMRKKVIAARDIPRNFITTLLIGFAFWFALEGDSSGGQSVELMVLTITYMFQILRNVVDLTGIIHVHDDHVIKIHPTLEVLEDKYADIKDPEEPVEFKPGKGGVTIQDVDFSYPDNQEKVFENLNINVDPGEKIGIVGLSGAGKSTLANLVMRFDEVSAGSIKIGGIDIRDVTQSDLRSKIAYVPQEPLLFHRTIRENIAYFQRDVSEADVIEASKAAHAHEFVDKLPNKYDTVVGERGVKLSGGQKQRVVIARAVLKKAPVLIFDEATSALDSESEHIIQRALPAIMGDHTAIVIAHRLSTVSKLDRIIVMHDGKIVEEGTHRKLLAKRGRYAKLWHRQISESND